MYMSFFYHNSNATIDRNVLSKLIDGDIWMSWWFIIYEEYRIRRDIWMSRWFIIYEEYGISRVITYE